MEEIIDSTGRHIVEEHARLSVQITTEGGPNADAEAASGGRHTRAEKWAALLPYHMNSIPFVIADFFDHFMVGE